MSQAFLRIGFLGDEEEVEFREPVERGLEFRAFGLSLEASQGPGAVNLLYFLLHMNLEAGPKSETRSTYINNLTRNRARREALKEPCIERFKEP